MLMTKRHLSRRTVLKGIGVTAALPLLEAMLPAHSAAAQSAAKGKVRLAAIEMVHGAAGSSAYGAKMNMWSPAATGKAFDLSPSALSPLESVRQHITIVSNTDLRMAEAFTTPEIGGDHFRASAVFLTQAHPKQTMGSDVRAGIYSTSSTRRETARTRRSRRCSSASSRWIRPAAVNTATRASTRTRSAGASRKNRCP